MKKQTVAIAINGARIVIDKKSDPANIAIVAKLAPSAFYHPKKK